MLDGFYTQPKYQRVQSKIAVVIPVYIPENPKKNYGHFVEDKIETIMLNLKAHKHFRAGLEYDIILVDHSPVPFHFQDEPMYQILRKPNFGYSFGAYKQAWEEYGSRYDFYLFHEDDIVPAKDRWLIEIMMKFLSKKDIGCVGNFVEARSENENSSDIAWNLLNYTRDMMYNFDGAFHFTSSKILRQVDEIGGLPVHECQPVTNLSATINEMIFQQPILELGYRIESFADGNHFVVHGSEIYTNDIMYRKGPFCPLMNINGRHHVPEIAKLYQLIMKEDE